MKILTLIVAANLAGLGVVSASSAQAEFSPFFSAKKGYYGERCKALLPGADVRMFSVELTDSCSLKCTVVTNPPLSSVTHTLVFKKQASQSVRGMCNFAGLPKENLNREMRALSRRSPSKTAKS